VCSDSCYTFVIYDSWGDGIYAPGGYAITFDGELVASTIGSGWYGSEQTVEDIGVCVTLGACWIGYCGVCVDTTEACCEYAGGEFQGWGNLCADYPAPICAEFDIKPGSCPNSFNRGSNGVLPTALVGETDFDVMDVDVESLLLSRLDGVGGAVGPNVKVNGQLHVDYEDVATPFENEDCECHEMEGDGIMDLTIKFNTNELVAALEMGDLDPGALVPLLVTGTLMDGTMFAAMDCVRLVPPGSPPGQLSVTSNLPEAWVDVTPLDEQLDGGGYADFSRTYPVGTVVSLTAGEMPGRSFAGWKIDGASQRGPSIQITVTEDLDTVQLEALYLEIPAPAGQQTSPQGQVGGAVPLP
jgi:hypothetical protein